MTPTLQQLEKGDLGPGEVDAFLASHNFPIVEGTTITFLFRGQADEVNLRHWIHGLSTTQPFARVHGTDLWISSRTARAWSTSSRSRSGVRGG